ncbi:hybrid sensor histidine kinase/response regulator [Lysobacteraceae bacterium NML08-0793]|nr:hybrid sensor histidine kinase/response regulator [Xanthomonadaceae bacterium NML08-0793]
MNVLREAIDHATLGWIKPELDASLLQVRQEIETFVEDGADPARMHKVAALLHQVQGSLRMIELYAPAMLSGEMQEMANAIEQGQVEAVNEACAILMRGALQLPDYLERLQGGHRDIPIVLMPLVNELREARGLKPVSEGVFFSPDLDRAAASVPDARAAAVSCEAQLAVLDKSLDAWNGGRPVDFSALNEALDVLGQAPESLEARRLFWVAANVSAALRDGALEADAPLRDVFASVEREARSLFGGGDNSTPLPVSSLIEPTRQLLYQVASSKAEHPALAQLNASFGLGSASDVSEGEYASAKASVTGINRALLDTVSAAVKEDVLRVKDALDLYLRTGRQDAEALAPQAEALGRIADTLGMLDLGMAREVVAAQRDTVADLAAGRVPMSENALLDVAGALLYVDASLDDQVARLGEDTGSDAGIAPDSLGAAEARQLMDALSREAVANFDNARQAFVAFVETGWDHAQLVDVPALLQQVAGALRMLELPEAADYLTAISRYTKNELLGRKRIPGNQQLDTLADALSSIEYYLEALREQRGGRENILSITRYSLEALHYWPLPPENEAEEATPFDDAQTENSYEAWLNDANKPEPSEQPAAEVLAVAADEDAPQLQQTAADSAYLQLDEDAAALAEAQAADVVDVQSAEAPANLAQAPVEAVEAAGPLPVEAGGFDLSSDEIDDEIREIFLEEVEEEIRNLDELLPQWRQAPDNLEQARSIRRVFHTLKGSGRLVGARLLGEFSWKVENMLNRVLDGTRPATPAVLALVGHAHEALPALLAALTGTPIRQDLAGIEATADRLAEGEEAHYQPAPLAAQPEAPAVEQTVAQADTASDSVAVEVDSVLLEILDTEVAGHLQTLDRWLADPEAATQVPSNELLRAVHTMNGAFAMAEVPEITRATAPTESWLKRSLAAGAAAGVGGVALLGELAQQVRATMAGLTGSVQRVPLQDTLTAHAEQLRDTLPEAALADVHGQVLEAERLEAQRLEAERLEAERLEAERLEAERLEAERLEAERLEAERLEAERLEAERLEAERLEAERLEAERLEAERLEAERLEAQRLEAERLEAERLEVQRLEAEHAPADTGSEPAAAEVDLLAAVREEEEQRWAAYAEQQRASAEAQAQQARLAEALAQIEARANALIAEVETRINEQESDPVEVMRLAAIEFRAQAEQAALRAKEFEDFMQVEDARLQEVRAGDPAYEESRRQTQLQIEVAREVVARLEKQADIAALREREFRDFMALEEERLARLQAPQFHHAVYVEPEAREAAAKAVSLQADSIGPDSALDMTGLDEDLLEIFIEEGNDLLDQADDLAARLRTSPGDVEVLQALQRNLHTLKGGARMAGIMTMGDLGHALESLLESAAETATELLPGDISLAESALDRLHAMLGRISQRRAVYPAEQLVQALMTRARGEALAEVQDGETAPQVMDMTTLSAPMELGQEEGEASGRSSQEQVRVRADLLERLVNYAGEVAIYRSRLEQQLGAFRSAMAEMEQTNTRLRDQVRRLDIETEAQIVARYQREQDATDQTFDPLELDRFSTLQQLSRALGESANDLSSLQGSLEELTRQYETLLQQQSRVSTELQEGLMSARMVSVESALPRLRRVVRQAAGDVGKEVQFVLDGAQGELDRNVLDRMLGPLEHLLRNAVAHGIETPEKRKAAGKPASGEVRLKVSQEGSEVVLQVIDDGAGIDREAVRRRAESRGLIAPGAELSDAQLDNLILVSGFSTADTVSQVAGRGVGMDVVNNEVRQIGGGLQISSTPGQGSCFTLHLPQTLAVTQAVFVRIGENTFAVPVASVRAVSRIERSEYESPQALHSYGGEDYQVHDLGLLLGQGAVKAEGQLQVPLLLVRSGDLRVAVGVDQIIGNREIVVKPTGPQINSIPGIFGATVMGDGRVMIILDIAPLARRHAGREALLALQEAPNVKAPSVPLIMVVDDSITMRKVTSRVLTRQGFEVVTAKDGLDALERLEERIPDVMLLDIEMPRMDGYELASAMKRHTRLRHIPIVMITSRSGDKHRQRAFDLGVSRYLGKPYQEPELLRNVNELLGRAREQG